MERAVLLELNDIIGKYFDETSAEARITLSRNIESKRKELQKECSVYQSKINDLKKAIQNMYIDKARGIISEAEYFEFKASFNDDIVVYQNRIDEAKQQLLLIEQQLQCNRSKKDILEEYRNIQKLDRSIMDKLVDYIEVGRCENKQHKNDLPPIVIHWKF